VTVRKPSRQLDLDPGGVAGHRLVHGVVEDLGEQMVQRLLVGAADIHARAAAHRLQPLQHLDVGQVLHLRHAARSAGEAFAFEEEVSHAAPRSYATFVWICIAIVAAVGLAAVYA
jgi:hypothetical protein